MQNNIRIGVFEEKRKRMKELTKLLCEKKVFVKKKKKGSFKSLRKLYN